MSLLVDLIADDPSHAALNTRRLQEAVDKAAAAELKKRAHNESLDDSVRYLFNVSADNILNEAHK